MKILITILLLLLLIKQSQASNEDVNFERIQTMVNQIAESTNKIANWYIEKLDTKLSNVIAKLTNVENSVGKIQEKSHVWESLQLHVSAWNEQSLSMERKLGILSRSGERLETSADKLSVLNTWDSKINFIVDALKNFNLDIAQKDDEIVLEFAKRGALTVLQEIHDGMQIMMSNCSQKNSIFTKINRTQSSTIDNCNSKSKPLLANITKQFQSIESLIRGRENLFINLYDDFQAYLNSPIHKKTRKSFVRIDELIDNLDVIRDSLERTSDRITLKDLQKELELQRNVYEAAIESNAKLVNLQFDKIYTKLTDQENLLARCIFKETESIKCERCNNEGNVAMPNEGQFHDGCAWNLKNGVNRSDVFDFTSNEFTTTVTLPADLNIQFCDNSVSGGGWTVISRRGNHKVHGKVDFNRTWEEYDKGFGYLDGEFWLGNEKIHKLTRQNDMILRVDLEDFEGNKVFAEYGTFLVHGPDKLYEVWIGGYYGNATDSFSAHSGSKFSTFDKTNDDAPPCCPCAPAYGGGWWFYSCFESNLNGIYFNDPQDNGFFEGIIWEKWKGDYSLKIAEMKLRPKWLEDYLVKTSTIDSRYTYIEDP